MPKWALVEPMIAPAKRGGRRREVNVREVLNAIFYVLSTGCQWQALPKDLPPKSTAHSYFMLWDWDGTLERVHHARSAAALVRLAMIRIMLRRLTNLRVPLSTYAPGRRIWKNNPLQSRKSHWSPSGPISNSPPRRRSPEACLPPLPARAMSPPRSIAKQLVFWARLF